MGALGAAVEGFGGVASGASTLAYATSIASQTPWVLGIAPTGWGSSGVRGWSEGTWGQASGLGLGVSGHGIRA